MLNCTWRLHSFLLVQKEQKTCLKTLIFIPFLPSLLLVQKNLVYCVFTQLQEPARIQMMNNYMGVFLDLVIIYAMKNPKFIKTLRDSYLSPFPYSRTEKKYNQCLKFSTTTIQNTKHPQCCYVQRKTTSPGQRRLKLEVQNKPEACQLWSCKNTIFFSFAILFSNLQQLSRFLQTPHSSSWVSRFFFFLSLNFGNLPSQSSLAPIGSKMSVYLHASCSHSVFGCCSRPSLHLCYAQPTSGEEQAPLPCSFPEEVAPKTTIPASSGSLSLSCSATILLQNTQYAFM